MKFAQQVLNSMVVFPASPSTLFPLESFRLAVTVRVVTPTETQLPCSQQRAVFTNRLYFNMFEHDDFITDPGCLHRLPVAVRINLKILQNFL